MKYKVSALVLNWDCLEVAKDSIRLLLHEGHEVILIDNGSTDGSKEFFRDVMDDNFKLIDFPRNVGISKGRNAGIKLATGKDIFLLDADILYVKGTIAEYQRILDKYKDAFCVGQNSMELLNRLGHNGTSEPSEADYRMGDDYVISEGFPMVWTQYGYFRGDLLRKIKFTEIPPFNVAGYGAEDDFMFQEIEKRGLVSLACSLPIYYHYAHNSQRQFNKLGQDNQMKERIKVFEKCWGKDKLWAHRAERGITFSTRPNP